MMEGTSAFTEKGKTMLKIIDADITVQEAIDANDGYCPCAIEQGMGKVVVRTVRESEGKRCVNIP